MMLVNENSSSAHPEPSAQALPPAARDSASAGRAGALEIRDVIVRFGGLTALDGVSLTARRGQVTGIIGPNGAGKTTLLNAICGFVRPQAGELSFDGASLARVRPHRLASRGIARTLQGLGLFGHLTVLENVMVGAGCHARAGFWRAFLGWSAADERRLAERARDALAAAGAADLADRMPGELPYGLRKRVAIARALAVRPRLLLLDEPASGLSEQELPELSELIRGVAADACVVLIEHRIDLMMSACDTIVVLDFGKVIATGPPREVLTDPTVTSAYLGATGDG
jgi:branched-chain amino acid transport system ATP-binding protein